MLIRSFERHRLSLHLSANAWSFECRIDTQTATRFELQEGRRLMEFIDLSFNDSELHLGFRLSRYGVKELNAPNFPRDYPLNRVGASPLLAG